MRPLLRRSMRDLAFRAYQLPPCPAPVPAPCERLAHIFEPACSNKLSKCGQIIIVVESLTSINIIKGNNCIDPFYKNVRINYTSLIANLLCMYSNNLTSVQP